MVDTVERLEYQLAAEQLVDEARARLDNLLTMTKEQSFQTATAAAMPYQPLFEAAREAQQQLTLLAQTP